MPPLEEIIAWLSIPANAIEKVLVPLALALVLWLAVKFRSLGALVGSGALAWVGRVRKPLDERLERYRRQLDELTFRVHHAWMKEGQTLADVLVPVIIESEEAGGIEDWSVVLGKFFARAKQGPQRLAVIGGPGSGKSVALKVAAREAWRLQRGDGLSLVPVLLTFNAYRDADFDLVKAMHASLCDRGFALPGGHADDARVRSFVEEGLVSGRFLVIVDALDELELTDRKHAAHGLAKQLGRYSKTPVIISCRTAAWRGKFTELEHETISMAGFTPDAIRRFVRHWDFAAPKNSRELIETIESRPHIGELARSPLMLTIIAFLYSQPKYHLPENRAAFYDICSRALLEEWDQHKNPDHANRFERHHKEHVLAELAYRHLVGERPDADLDERTTLAIIASVMQALSLKSTENLQILDEICEKSGLLVRLPPNGLRFPHQTFLEFFAALYLVRLRDQDRVFRLYESDPQRWREVLLLYIGLGESVTEVSTAVERLRQAGSREITLAALADARAIEPRLAESILREAHLALSDLLQTCADGAVDELITMMGHVASNARTAHSDVASDILRDLLFQRALHGVDQLRAGTLEVLLLASLRRPTEATSKLVIDHVDRLRLGFILPIMGERVFVLSAKLMGDTGLTATKKREWIDALRRARAAHPLLEILQSGTLDPEVRCACIVALVRISGTDEFREALAGGVLRMRFEASGKVRSRWGWPFENPHGEAERDFMLYLAEQFANLPEGLQGMKGDKLLAADVRVKYLVSGLRRYSGRGDVLLEEMGAKSFAFVLRAIWVCVTSGFWKWWIRREMGVKVLFLSFVICGVGSVGLIVAACVVFVAEWALDPAALAAYGLVFAWLGLSVVGVIALRKSGDSLWEQLVGGMIAAWVIPFRFLPEKWNGNWRIEGRNLLSFFVLAPLAYLPYALTLSPVYLVWWCLMIVYSLSVTLASAFLGPSPPIFADSDTIKLLDCLDPRKGS